MNAITAAISQPLRTTAMTMDLPGMGALLAKMSATLGKS
jgi:hypothetical protein